jgi:hypothetical protein
MALLILVVVLLVLAAAATVGADSRDSADWVKHPRP